MQIGIDIGNYYTKSSEGVKFESRITEDDSIQNGSVTSIEYNGKNYLIEEGTFDSNINKLNKGTFMISLATMLAMSTNEMNIELAIGLPVNHYATQKDKLLDLIYDNEEIVIYYKGEKRRYYISKCVIVPEAVGVYYSLPSQFLAQIKNRDVIMLDIGGKTTDTCLIDNRMLIQKPNTQPYGMIGLYNQISNAINNEYPELCVKPEEVNHILNNGLYEFDKKLNVDFIENIIDKFVADIINLVKLQYVDYQRKIVIVCGGGGAFLGERIRKYIPNAIVNSDIFANAKGFKKYLQAGGR